MKNYFKDIFTLFTASVQNEELKRKFHRWLLDEEHADEKEIALYDCWLHTKGNKNEDLEKALSDIYFKANIEGEGQRITISRLHRLNWRKPLKYAAVVAALVVSVYTTRYFTKREFSQIGTIEKYISPGEMQWIELPDGSRVQANSGTLLLYPEKFIGKTRTVFLVGEANFKVKKNPEQPFIVRSGMMSVTALGTEFNVNAYSDGEEIKATLLEGKVKVVCGQDGQSYFLEPGQQVVYNKGMGTSGLLYADVNDVTAWQRGELVFRSMTLKEIGIELQRRFNITFKYESGSFNDDRYNFRFPSQATFNEVMKVVRATVSNFDYRIDGKFCYIENQREGTE